MECRIADRCSHRRARGSDDLNSRDYLDSIARTDSDAARDTHRDSRANCIGESVSIRVSIDRGPAVIVAVRKPRERAEPSRVIAIDAGGIDPGRTDAR